MVQARVCIAVGSVGCLVEGMLGGFGIQVDGVVAV